MSVPTRKMWHVEKFLPTECPKCRKEFKNQIDWSLLLGDIVDGKKKIRETKGYDIINCAYCGNHTARVELESYTLSDRAKAERFLGEGFVNLCEVKVFGHMEDTHMVYTHQPNICIVEVEKLK